MLLEFFLYRTSPEDINSVWTDYSQPSVVGIYARKNKINKDDQKILLFLYHKNFVNILLILITFLSTKQFKLSLQFQQ